MPFLNIIAAILLLAFTSLLAVKCSRPLFLIFLHASLSSLSRVKGARKTQHGGAVTYRFTFDDIKDSISTELYKIKPTVGSYDFINYALPSRLPLYVGESYVYCNLDLDKVVAKVPVRVALRVLKTHGVPVSLRWSREDVSECVRLHSCANCPQYITVIRSIIALTTLKHEPEKPAEHFPPSPLTENEMHTVLSAACDRVNGVLLQESGCGVCGQLRPMHDLVPIAREQSVSLLEMQGITCAKRRNLFESVTKVKGPVLDKTCPHIVKL